MGKPLDFWTLLGIFSGLIGVATALATRAFPNPSLYWVAGGSIAAASIIFLVEFLVWVVSKLTWTQVAAAALSGTLIAVSIIIALEWSLVPRETHATANADAAGEKLKGRKRQSEAPGKPGIKKVTKVTLPGYTSTVLIQMEGNSGEGKSLVFKDASTDGTEVSLASTEDNSFIFTVKSARGETYNLDVASGPDGIPLDKNVYVTCVAGNENNSGFLRVLVDGEEVSRFDFESRIDFGNRQWTSKTEPDRTKLRGVRASIEGRLLAPWALSDDKLAEQEASFRYAHSDFFNGDDSLLYAPLGTRRVGPSPISGTFMQLTMPPE
jgi:hypothetical protein